ncbi:autotransporter-associated N-terminal domain-containing protein [Fusobacterium varium]|uniref:autotransporter-associated N-terminal domain-containing protein n=1 Tax=Fusobacterium TaxID=848 RepID=UPI0030D0C56E
MRKGDIEKSLKRFLKRKVSYSLALLIAFMITGGISLGAEITAEEIQESKGDLLSKIQTEREEIKRKIAENERLIKEYNSNFVELVRKGDFYSKPLFNSTQVFFSYQHLDSGKMKDVTDKEFSETIDAINKHYGTRSGRSILKSTGNIGKDKLMAGNGVAVDTEVFRETIEVGANIKPVEPVLPEINPNVSVNVSAPVVTLSGLPGVITVSTPKIDPISFSGLSLITLPSGVTVTVTPPSPVDKITVSKLEVITLEIPEKKDISVEAPKPPEGFIPTTITPPVKPGAPEVKVPENFDPPVISFIGGGFSQGSAIGMPKNNIIIQNYDTYKTDAPVVITTGNSGTTWTGGTITVTTSSNGSNYPATVGTYSLGNGSTTVPLNAFINELRDHDADIGGNYVMTDTGGGNNVKIFLSHNPAGVGGIGGSYDGVDKSGPRTAKFTGTLELRGITVPNNVNILVGVEHQLWNMNCNLGAYSIFENQGTITLADGNNIIGIMIDTENSPNANGGINKTVNKGKIVINSHNSIGIDFGQFNQHNLLVDVFVGNIEINGENNYGLRMKDVFGSSGFGATYFDKGVTITSGTDLNGSPTKITVGGKKNVGVSISKYLSSGKNINPIDNISKLNIEVTGENVVGFLRNAEYSTNNPNDMLLNGTTMGTFSFGAGATNSVLIRSDKYGIQIDKDISSESGETGNVFAQATKTGKIINNAVLSSTLKSFTGLLASGTGDASVENTGTVKITGDGSNNVGIAVLDSANGKNSGTIEVLGAGNNKSGIYNKGTFTISGGSVTVEGGSSSGIYNTGITNINGTVALKGTGGTTGIYSNGGQITSNSGNQLSIIIDDTSSTAKGLAVYAEGGANLNLSDADIIVTEGAAGVAAFGEGTNINLSRGNLKFNGSGYAVYSDGTGKIDLSGATITLNGSSTAFDFDLAEGVEAPIILDEDSRINANDDKVIVFNLKNAKKLSTDGLEDSIKNSLGEALGNVNLNDLLSHSTATNYKIAAVDGGEIAIGDLDKTGTGEETDLAKIAGNFYYNRFLGQRLKATAKNSKISAVLTDEQAKKYNNQVVGLEMNSSKLATSANETRIDLEGSTIITADRNGAGAGAIGAYINYGFVTLNGNSRIKVEREKDNGNTANDNAVGVYAVNGSTVYNATGTIAVGGNQSIGILGMAYREDENGNAVIDEYGSAALGQGTTTIYNGGTIFLDGEGSIGIYADNNNTSVGTIGAQVLNQSGIIVGDSNDSATSVGIYGKKAQIYNDSSITVGSGGVAIYATEGSEVAKLGTLKLGSDGIGVMVDGTSTITATTVTLESKENTVDINGKTGIFYKGTATGSDNKEITLTIDASNFVKGTAIYVQDMTVKSSGKLTVGAEGIGIFVAKRDTGAAAGTNQGTINLGTSKNAIGMYGKDTSIANEIGNGIINIGNSSQIGMYAEGANGKVTNTGIINLNVDGAKGIYVRNDATAEITGANINFSTHNSSIGVYAEGAKVNFKSDVNFENNNENKNIYVYGKDSTVEIAGGETVTIDGGSIPTAVGTEGNKTVGIYLENAGAGSTFKGTGELKVENGAIGIYSKGNNSLDVKVTAEGDKTTGVFIDGESKIKGTVTAKTDAIGVYGSGGAVVIDNTGLTLNIGTASISNKGTGMYLTDGAYATGGLITVDNFSDDNNIGVYYSKGTASGPVTNESEIELTGKNGVGIYAADGITLVNDSNITSIVPASNSIASYVGGDSTLTSNGTIELKDTANGIGIYAAASGTGINSVSGEIKLTAATGSMVGMASKGTDASVENQGTITVGNNLGMYITDGSSGKNSGEIKVEKGTTTTGTTTGTGVYIEGTGNSFDGTGGTIKSDAIGIYLKDTTAGTVTNTGTLEIASGGVGVFGENAKIDFNVNVTGTGAVGVAASSNSVISGNVTTGKNSVGVYVLDNSVSFNGANITTEKKAPGGTSIGILLNSAVGSYTMSNVIVSAQDGVGIYLDGTGSGIDLTHNGTVNTVGGIGIYVANGTALTTGKSVLNINGGTGIYVDGGTANLGTTETLTFNFGIDGGIGVYNNGGTLNFGNNISTTGSGSLAATVNGDLASSGNLNIGEGGTGLLGKYDVGTIADKNITNTGNIIAKSGGIGLAAVEGNSTPSGGITINNTGTITASGKSSGGDSSIGIYTDVAAINNTNTINVGTDGIGIYATASGKAVKNDNMTMTGDNGIGVYIKGATGGLTANNITSTGGKGNTGVLLEGVTSDIDTGTITLGDESIGVMATGTTSSPITIAGTITVGDSGTGKSAIGIVTSDGSDIILAGTTEIKAGKGGIGVYAEGAGTTVAGINASNITVGTDGIYLYSTVGTSISFTGNITADNQIGIVAARGSVSGTGSTITAKNGGIGAYVKGTGSQFTETNIVVQSGIAETGTDPAKYSVGVYYEDAGAIASLPTVTQAGSYSIGTVLDRTTGTTTAGINIGTSGSNQVGVMAKGNSVFTIASGGIAVADGDSNIGIYGENSTINVAGDISVGTASSLTNSSIGVSLKGGSYRGTTGDLAVGNNSIGIYGTNMTGNISQSGTTMTVGDNGVGIYGSGTGNIILSMTTTGITLGNNNSIGVYAKGMNTSVTGDVAVGANTSIGIVSEGNGNVTHDGDVTIAGKGTGEKDTGSVGIYKLNGTGTITTTIGNNWTVGNNGYGIFVKQNTEQKVVQSVTINNKADMTLGMSAVGIYSSGANTVNNDGTITVGETDTKGDPNKTQDHLNSVGIYVTNGTTVNNTGTINVEHDFSVGIYGSGIGTKITNVLGATISVDKGGVGILVQNEAVAENEGTITLGSTAGIYGATTVGMAAYSGASIINGSTGIINVGIGSGMVVGVGATLTNNGVINVTNGIGIEGAGHIINQGTIDVTGTGTDVGNTGVGSAEVGSIKIESNGDVIINDKYVGIGGTLTTAGAIEVNGAYVDVTTGVPLFNAQSVSGEVNILPNFALTGNGITYKIEGFVNTAMGTITGTKLTPVTSPLFIAKVTDKGDLVIAKRPYADLTIGEQFDALDKGLDNILANSGGIGKDAEILKGLNAYLEGLPDYQFEGEASRKLAETRGDIYSTIQGRMQDINRAFDNSFYELESSYNLTKDSSKYSVIYTDGDYKDPTLGIEDYDYKIMGLLYMKEKEGTEYGSKYGYTLGFTGSKFEFENDSKEDVYSLRAGVHRVKNLSEEHKVSWLSRIELGYNRHIAERKLNLHETFENKGEYNTYSVALDNRITKVIYTDLSRELDIYADLDLEYGKVDGFTESAGSNGGLEVQIKDNDYLSAQLGAGVKASQRIYAGNDVSVKVTADVKYAYELGDNYDGNKARLKNGGEGYYSLITPDEREGKLIGKVGLTVEKANYMGVTFEVEAADEGNREDSSVKYGVRFNYKF